MSILAFLSALCSMAARCPLFFKNFAFPNALVYSEMVDMIFGHQSVFILLLSMSSHWLLLFNKTGSADEEKAEFRLPVPPKAAAHSAGSQEKASPSMGAHHSATSVCDRRPWHRQA